MSDSLRPCGCSMPGFPVHYQLLELAQTQSMESVMPSNHLILCRPLLLPSVFPGMRVFSNESFLLIRWPKYWSFSISPSTEYSGLVSFRIDQVTQWKNGQKTYIDISPNKTYRPTNTWKDAQHHLLEKCKSKLQWGITSHQSEWSSSKNLQTINAGEDVEQRELHTVGADVL